MYIVFHRTRNPPALWAARGLKGLIVSYLPVHTLDCHRTLGSALLQLADFNRNLLRYAVTLSATGNDNRYTKNILIYRDRNQRSFVDCGIGATDTLTGRIYITQTMTFCYPALCALAWACWKLKALRTFTVVLQHFQCTLHRHEKRCQTMSQCLPHGLPRGLNI